MDKEEWEPGAFNSNDDVWQFGNAVHAVESSDRVNVVDVVVRRRPFGNRRATYIMVVRETELTRGKRLFRVKHITQDGLTIEQYGKPFPNAERASLFARAQGAASPHVSRLWTPDG